MLGRDLMKDIIDILADENVQESNPTGHGWQVIIKCHVEVAH